MNVKYRYWITGFFCIGTLGIFQMYERSVYRVGELGYEALYACTKV